MKLHSKQYISYINSFDWYLKRRSIMERARGICESCKQAPAIEVHHKTYDRLGNEKDEDLTAVCEPCHKKEDIKHQNEVENERYFRRLDGWASKKYGEDWTLYMDQNDVSDEFEEWLEKRNGL